MYRRYFYVTEAAQGWEVRDDARPAWCGGCCSSSAAALALAVRIAREHWEGQGQATGVRVHDLWGQWRDEAVFGSGLPLRQRDTNRLTREQPALKIA